MKIQGIKNYIQYSSTPIYTNTDHRNMVNTVNFAKRENKKDENTNIFSIAKCKIEEGLRGLVANLPLIGKDDTQITVEEDPRIEFLQNKTKNFVTDNPDIQIKASNDEQGELIQTEDKLKGAEHKKPVIRTAKVRTVQNYQLPKPNFSFDYPRLEQELSVLDEVDANWVENNPESVKNILDASTKGAQISPDGTDAIFSTPDTKAVAINLLLAKKEAFLQEGKRQHSFEQQAYIDSIAQYLKPNDMGDMTDQALDALAKYGTGEDLKKINGIVKMEADEARTKKIIQTAGAIGRKDIDARHIISYIAGVHNHANDTYVELFKATKKLFSNYYEKGRNFEDLMRFANRIPTDETGEYTKEYIDMLISVGRKEDIEFLNKYLRNYNHINEFIENKQQTPQVIVDAIEKARQGILAKH